MAIQNIDLYLKRSNTEKATKTILLFSTLGGEGKSVIAGNLAQKLKLQGKKVLVLDFSHEILLKTERSQIGYSQTPVPEKIMAKPAKKQRISIISLLLGYPDTRIDFDSPFLENTEKVLDKGEYFVYNDSEKFYAVKNYKDILEQNTINLDFIPDFVIIELPPILFYPYPVSLIADADIPVLVSRANRVWTNADQVALNVLTQLTEKQTHFILNGVELPVIEYLLGDLPKKRSRLRRLIKKLFRLEFYSRNHI